MCTRPGCRDIIPSTISELQSRIANVLGEIEKVDFTALAKDIAALAQTARKQIDAADIKGLVDQWKKTGAQFQALAGDADIKRTGKLIKEARITAD